MKTMTNSYYWLTTRFGLALWTLLTLSAGGTLAVPPCPELLNRAVAPGAAAAPMLISTHDLHQKGICTPDDFFLNFLKQRPRADASLAPTANPFKILAILVKFTDHPSQVVPTFFDSLIFDSSGGNTVKSYFNEISNTQIDLVTVNLPSSIGWVTADSTYAYYVDGKYGTNGIYPHNAQKLVEELVDKVNPQVNFANYDNDGNGTVDVLLVIHSGTGAEKSGNANDIWSHKWAINSRLCDGVYISSYTIQPEFWTTPGDMTIGVYSHELCHGFGLPDLYDINTGNGDSYGVGKWCIMAYGCWNGPTNLGEIPSHPSAWCRIKMGVATATNVTANTTNRTITPVETGGTMYRLWSSGVGGNEYFLIENRQQTGYDAYLPGSGLLIWHIDEGKVDNGTAWWPGLDSTGHYLVALEQADGLWQLEHKGNLGNTADPFPGSGNKTIFSSLSTPSSNAYLSGATSVAVNNIAASGSDIIADLVVGLAASIDTGATAQPRGFTLSQNYPNPFNPNTVIDFELQSSSHVTLEVYNCTGQRVRTLFDGLASAGLTRVVWDGADAYNHPVASGVYLYKLTNDNNGESTRKMVLVR